ncbi:hypothetical protein [Streptomyces filamentosus]|uniref:hypothetical protein n=1 Tax=Streptomyces filamentosus TaxID=67294 RepID=UPI0012385DEE|nr:hypothetical protein [Streptomyces filamentosus]KAA6220019.1 hypothetical protein CP979_26335 [Streptomyces filamentosus]
MSDPITPTRIIPAGVPLPPAGPPSQPPPPPAWFTQPPPPRPPTPQPLDIRVTVDLLLPGTEPEPAPSWRQRIRIRWIYNIGCLAFALPLSGPWAAALASVRDEQGLAGAWTLAVIPLAVVGILDNARRVEAEHAAPDLWAPRIRAALTRTALWALVTATATALPVDTVVYLLTGVRP